MSRLKQILERALEKKLKMGGAVSNSVIDALHTYRKRLFITFLILFAILVCVVAFGTYGLTWFIQQPSQMTIVASAMGLSVGGAIELLRRIWQDWSQAELILILIEDASEAQIIALTDKLIEKL